MDVFASVASNEELDYERPLSERDLAESWESDRFDETGGDFADETWSMVKTNHANAS